MSYHYIRKKSRSIEGTEKKERREANDCHVLIKKEWYRSYFYYYHAPMDLGIVRRTYGRRILLSSVICLVKDV
jgi:hypothetical protein